MKKIPVTYAYPWAVQDENTRRTILKDLSGNGIKNLVLESKIIERIFSEPELGFKYQKELKEFDLNLMDAHAPWGTWKYPGMPLEEFHELITLRHKAAIRICNQFNVTSMAFHTGNTFNSIFGNFTLDDYYNMMIRTLEELIHDAEKYNVVLCLENQWTPLNHSSCLIKAVEYFNSPFIGLCYDTGHAHMAQCGKSDPENSWVPQLWNDLGQPVKWEEKDMIDNFQPYVVNCHFHDNNGFQDNHKLPGEGTIDNWEHIIDVLRNAPRLQCIQSETSVSPAEMSVADLRNAYLKLSEFIDA